jgi:hypothetical protein
MLDLSSPRCKKLSQAYGSAEDIPALLIQLRTAAPAESFQPEPWNFLWGLSLSPERCIIRSGCTPYSPWIEATGLRKIRFHSDVSKDRPREKLIEPFLVRRGVSRNA